MNLNVDPAEIAKFEALAARWWDLHSEFKPLHAINPLRIGWIDERAHLHGKKVADIGCGGGIVAEAMALRGATVTGIDMGEAPLKVAQLHSLESGVDVDYRQMTAEQLAEEETGLYDVVTCLEMLEHVPDPSAVVAACAKLLKPGGQAFFSTINRNPKSYLFAIIGAEYVLNLLEDIKNVIAVRLLKSEYLLKDSSFNILTINDQEVPLQVYKNVHAYMYLNGYNKIKMSNRITLPIFSNLSSGINNYPIHNDDFRIDPYVHRLNPMEKTLNKFDFKLLDNKGKMVEIIDADKIHIILTLIVYRLV